MLKKTLAIILTTSVIFSLSACSLFPPVQTEKEVMTFDVSAFTKVESEVDTTVDTIEVESLDTESEVRDNVETNLISDNDALELVQEGHHTVLGWLKCNVSQDFKVGEPIYRNFGDIESVAFYPISQNAYAIMHNSYGFRRDVPYGNYDSMQTELKNRFTEKFIDKYFTYGEPFPFIYENGIVYFMFKDTPGFSPNSVKEYTIIHKTDNEIAAICEVYNYDWETWSIDYSKIASLGYIKLVKEDSSWLIDECYGYGDYFYVHPRDLIPSEYIDKIPEKYLSMTEYFEGYSQASSVIVELEDITNPLIYKGEPPFTEHELLLEVPDFLDLEQQILYRKAYSVYRHRWGNETLEIEYDETLDYYERMRETYTEKGYLIISSGRYQNWDDYMKLMLSVFTEEFHNKKNSGELKFHEYNGKLQYYILSKGGRSLKIGKDEFELISKTDNEIVFNLIGYYWDSYPYDENTKVNEKKYTIRMVMTESGWRFDEFHSTVFG